MAPSPKEDLLLGFINHPYRVLIHILCVCGGRGGAAGADP